MRKFISFALMALFSTSLWAGVTIFTSASQETTDGSWTLIGSSGSGNQSNVVFPNPAAETGFPSGTVSASTKYYNKLGSTSNIGSKLAADKCTKISGLSAGDQITVYWFSTSTDAGKLILSYATSESGGAAIETINKTPESKVVYSSTFAALSASDITNITSAYEGSAGYAYICYDKGCFIYAVKIVASTPVLTGAWKMEEDTVTGETINVLQGGTTPTMPTFSVGSTKNTPASSAYEVEYSLKEGSTAGIFTFTDGVPTAISTTTAGTATIVATLTTTNATNFKTPETNTFEYTVHVAEASAPSISVGGAGNVVRGGELTLTATVTGAVPDISYIKWYACNSEGTISGDPLGTELTYAPSTATVGTFYYRAVVNNGVGGDATHDVYSTVQTINVKPQAPVLPASAYFKDSKSVEISKSDGEAEGAIIKYSTDGENWNDYSDAIEVTATTTIQAKVVQSGLESTVASATYTKFSKSDLVSISDNTTWTFSYTGAPTIQLTSETTPTKTSTEYYTYADIAILNSADISGFSGSTTIAFRGEYALRGSNGFQNGWLKFNTTVAGSIEIEFSNTGGKNKNRYVKVNSTRGETEADGTTKRTETFNVSAGDVIITGVNGTSGEEGTGTDAAIRIYSIVFTKGSGTALDNVEGSASTVKVLENGQLIIEKNGVRYNALGQTIR